MKYVKRSKNYVSDLPSRLRCCALNVIAIDSNSDSNR